MGILSKPTRELCLAFQLDTNRLNAFGRLEYVNQLERWEENDVIALEMSETAQREARAGDSAQRSRKAVRYIASLDYITTAEERSQVAKIQGIVFPNGMQSENERNDVLVVFNALKYHMILVTNDGASKRQPRGILGCRDELKELGLRIMTDEEAVFYVKKKIEARDQDAVWWAQTTGKPVPDWVGKD